MEKTTFHVISHTHWDREWYLPYEAFRIELVELIDNLLDILKQNKNFIFHLDGQSIILQDYLEIKPNKKEEIKSYVKSGNILIGPWYVLSDQFLTSGESTIRNLTYGLQLAKEFGSAMAVGYCPDQFGEIAQLPQILKGFNISSVVVGRGIQDDSAEHIWYSLSGDNVLVIYLTHWYNNAQKLPDPTCTKKLHDYIEEIYLKQYKTSASGHILLMNGCDHLYPQENIQEILSSLDGNKKWTLKQSSLPSAIRDIIESNKTTDYPVCFGELRSDNNKYILAGTLSSRIYLKLANYRCQTNLEKTIEPLSAILSINKKADYPYEEIKHTWKLLLQNHAHDSICGCSIDDVHKENEIRFLKVNHIIEKLKEKLLQPVPKSQRRDTLEQRPNLQLINLSNYNRNDVIETNLEFPLSPPATDPGAKPKVNKKEIKALSISDNGKKIDFEILKNYQTNKLVRAKDEVPLLQAHQVIKVLLETNIDPYSACTYEIEPDTGISLALAQKKKPNSLGFENQTYKLKINKDGTISVLLKDNKYKFENIHYLLIEDDLGNEYDFVPKKDSKTTSSRNWKWVTKVTEENKFRKRFLLKSNDCPDLEPVIEITCYRNSDRIDFKTKINNKYKNKRVRLHFPTNLNTNYIYADTAFGILQRTRPPIDWVNYSSFQPLYNWIGHNNNNCGLAFFGGGLSEYELFEDGDGFAVTLIRAIGMLSGVASLSLIETPDAQCNRNLEFSYAIYPHTGNCEFSRVPEEQLKYQIPIINNQSKEVQNFSSLFSIPRELIVSALKRLEDKENIYLIRTYNPFNKKINNCVLKVNFQFKQIFLCNLNEEKICDLDIKDSRVIFDISPFQILNFGIEI